MFSKTGYQIATPLGDRTNAVPGKWPTSGDGRGMPPGGEPPDRGGPPESNPYYLKKALFLEGFYNAAEIKGELTVDLIRHPKKADHNPDRYSHSVSRHSEGAPPKFSNRHEHYSQFETNYIMHHTRNAFIDKYKNDIMALQRDIETGNSGAMYFGRKVDSSEPVGWVLSKDGTVTTTNKAYFGLVYEHGRWKEVTGHPVVE